MPTTSGALGVEGVKQNILDRLRDLDFEGRAALYRAALLAGTLSVNEVRRLEGFGPISQPRRATEE